ncbi:MAG TPA: Crp/Fnr family transcriptional regulator [Cytophagales bacterium]|nr:Crp/Fnr family transcriptional regulator [Cytophagales bacterium]HAA21807.1 Crp/Fnr family transcriptional regulator [Cytophagales bacterium]HAP58076.1 Crp/Fnr family transcriptional regulator [Cytophagales bacterium]
MTDRDHIFEFFNNQFPFNQEGLAEFSQAFQPRTYKKGTLLTVQGDQESELRFLEKGIVREFFSHQGKEMNTQFYLPQEFTTDFHLLQSGGTRKKYQECLTDATLRVLDKPHFFQFMDRYQCGKAFVEEIFRASITQREDEEFKHFSLTPDELYLDLLEHKPEWLLKIPLYHIATYLRMTPETLSRIRKRN